MLAAIPAPAAGAPGVIPVDVGAVVVPALAALLAATVLGAFAWARSLNRAVMQATQQLPGLVEKIGELAADVRELAAASTDALLTRAELRSHIQLADERWRMLGGFVPHPRYAAADDRIVPATAGEVRP